MFANTCIFSAGQSGSFPPTPAPFEPTDPAQICLANVSVEQTFHVQSLPFSCAGHDCHSGARESGYRRVRSDGLPWFLIDGLLGLAGGMPAVRTRRHPAPGSPGRKAKLVGRIDCKPTKQAAAVPYSLGWACIEECASFRT